MEIYKYKDNKLIDFWKYDNEGNIVDSMQMRITSIIQLQGNAL